MCLSSQLCIMQYLWPELLGNPPLSPHSGVAIVVISVDATSLWKASSTRADVWVSVWGGGGQSMELRLAAAGWLGGFGNPPPPGWLAGWLACPRKTAKIRSAPLYRLFSCMVWVWGWVCKGGGVGHLSRKPLPHTPSCLAFGTSHKDHIESPH